MQKVKKLKFPLEQAMKVQTRECRYRSTLFLASTLDVAWVFNATPRPTYPWERDQVPLLQEACLAPEPVRKGAENLSLTGIRSPDRSARSV